MVGTALVTGGSGYIAGELISQLLERGWHVHTTIRNRAKEPALRNRFADAEMRIKVFQADLMSDKGWAEAVAGCTHVAHVASPFPMGIPKNENDLIAPAKEGTLRALRFAKDAGITRFVQTSSAAAIAYGYGDEKTHFDQNDWSRTEGDNVPPYYKSKTIAERAARDWVAENAPEMEFCSINPVAVFGPVAGDDLSTSVELVKKMMDGSIPAIPKMGIGVVDVRDVAKAHVLALEADGDKVRGERFPASVKYMWLSEMAASLREQVPELSAKVPTRNMPDFIVRLLALFMPEMKQIAPQLGQVSHLDGSHSTDVLGFEYISAEQSLADTARSLAEHGILKGR